MAHEVPERIGKYTISRVLGQGAMGVVYQGFDPHIQRPVAIKTIHKNLLGSPEENAQQDSIAARFRNEAQAVGRIAHPGVVAIYEFGEDETSAYIAMEFVEGRNLDQVLAGTPLLPEAQLLRIMDQLLDALDTAHAHGVWHRDIKPANLLLTAAGQVKLTDFGIARIAHLGLTQVSSMIGTPGYMAPEQYTGTGVDQRSDLFACGVLLYRLLTGQPAFSGPAEVVMYKILNEHPVPPSQLAAGPARPLAYDSVVARALAKRPEDRYPSAQAFRQALAAIAMGAGAASSDATVIVPPAQWARTVEAAPGAGQAPQSGSAANRGTQGGTQGSGAVPTGWDAGTLSRIERALASHVGPMARLMVRNAARTCTDIGSLATAVSQHIPEAARRAQFMSTATGGSSAVAAAPTPQPTASGYEPTQALHAPQGEPLTEDMRQRAVQLLTRQLGPIAKVVVKRAADRAQGKADFLQQLAQAAPDVDVAGLLKDL